MVGQRGTCALAIRVSSVALVALAACHDRGGSAGGPTAPNDATAQGVTSKGSAAPAVNVLPAPVTGPAMVPSAAAARTLAALRGRQEVAARTAAQAGGEPFRLLGPALAESLHVTPGGLSPRFGSAAGAVTAKVLLPGQATAPLHIEDATTGMAVEVLLKDTRKSRGEAAGAGYLVYPNAHVSGATLLHRPLPNGLEDFLSFDRKPAASSIGYQVDLKNGVAGLRVVANTLEFLDVGGAPRLRIEPPYLVGHDGARTDARLAVSGCAIDENPAGPWGRRVTAPGARSCTVQVTWQAETVAYPAVLDPRWTSTGTMQSPRQDHTATMLSTGKVLVAAGRSSSATTTALATAELYDRTTNTWAATGSMTGARWSHAAMQLGTTASTTTSGKVLVTGGISGTTSQNTAQLYSVSAGTWVAAGNLPVGRHLHTATVLPDGRVLAVGGLTNTTVLNSAAIYNPASGAGTWTAVTATMSSARRSHTASLLTSSNTAFNNKVLIVGGNSTATGTTTLTTAQLFDIATSTWSANITISARESHTATTLANGNVLLTGGKSGTTVLGTTAIFTIPASGSTATFPSAGTMKTLRWSHTATLLPTALVRNGQVLVLAGGANATVAQASSETWDGVTTWTQGTADVLNPAVQGHTATLLTNGGVLIAGGFNSTGAVNVGQVYDPSFAVACTSNTQCASGFCASGVCCNAACTNQCSSCNLTGTVGTCTSKANGTSCVDTDLCTQTDTCQAGVCTGGNPKTCVPSDTCHTAGTCAPATGVCSNPTKAVGASCDDQNLCTQTDTCSASFVCVGSNPKTCVASDTCHTAGTCAPSTGVCSNPTKAVGASCDDQNPCTQTDTCSASFVCVGSNPKTCVASDTCHTAGTCSITTGLCSNPTKAVGASCDDQNPCTQTDTCSASFVCVGANPKTCAPTDSCHTAGTCSITTGLCSNPTKAVGASCDDGNPCTQTDTCSASFVCVGANPRTCPATDSCHTAGTCSISTGLCSNPTKAVGASCDDGNPCTQADTCSASFVCVGGSATVCPTPTICQTGSTTCNTTTGCPTLTHKPDWTICADANMCDGVETCQAGLCTHETPGGATTCSGGTRVTFYQSFDNDTTVDIAASSAVAREPDHLIKVPGLFGMAEDPATNPWLSYATLTQTIPTNIVLSKPGSVSMWLRPASGFERATLFEAFDNNAALELFVTASAADGINATLQDGAGLTVVSSNGTWTPDDRWHLVVVNWSRYSIAVSVDAGAPVVAPTNKLVTLPLAIDPTNLGNLVSPMAGQTGYAKDELIVLNRPLTLADIQWYYGQRLNVNPALPNPAIARFQADATNCDLADDLNPCTVDACSATGGVTHVAAAAGTLCDDGDPCTTADHCQGTTCVGGGATSKDDGNPCTIDSCDSAGGVSHTNAPDFTEWAACSDNNSCNGMESCHAGRCAAEVPGTDTTCAGPTIVTFYQSFDNGITADRGVTQKNPVSATPFVKVTGLFGMAMDSNASANADLAYKTDSVGANPANLTLTKPGSISMWFKPGPAYGPTTYLVVDDTNVRLVLGDNGLTMAATFERNGFAATNFAVETAGPVNWRADGRWHLVVVNWSVEGAAVSVDGLWSPVTTAAWMKSLPNGPNRVSTVRAGVPWPTAAADFARDELIIVNRPLTPSEVAWYLSQASVGGTPNPILARLDSDGTTCNAADDLNPCTVDSCTAVAGDVHNNATVGTACNVGGVCNAAGGCDVLPCPSGTTCAPAVRDLVTGVCHPAPVADGLACDDGIAGTSPDTCRGGTCAGLVPPSVGSVTLAALTDLGSIDGADSQMAVGINDRGDVAGSDTVRLEPWRYTAADNLRPVIFPTGGLGFPTGINSTGVIAGTVTATGSTHSVGFTAVPGITAVLAAPAVTSSYNGINDRGQVAGNYQLPGTSVRAIRVDGGLTRELPLFTGPTADGTGTWIANGIGPNGEVVGDAPTSDATRTFNGTFLFHTPWGIREAVRYTDSQPDGLENLNVYADGRAWEILYSATATNGDQTVGWGVTNDRCRAFRYTASTHEVLDLGTLGGNNVDSDSCWAADATRFQYLAPSSINLNGDVVGNIAYGGAFYYGSALRQMVNLQDFVDPALHVTITTAYAINNNGEIVGGMTVQGDAKTHAYKMKVPDWARNPGGAGWAKIMPRVDGIVDVGGGQYVVLFGYQNDNSTDVQLLVGDRRNSLARNATIVTNDSVAQPTMLAVGSHPGAFLPRGVVGETLTWTLAGKDQTITIAPSVTPPLAHVTRPGVTGYGVNIPTENGQEQFVLIESDMSRYLAPPDPTGFAQDPMTNGTFRGTLTGKLGVSPSGAATYTVPIGVSPGIAGVAPNLSLVYNSQGGDGIAGQGWELSGLSSIYRCPLTRTKDGYNRPMTMGDQVWAAVDANGGDDGFCLDGRRLYRQQSFDTSDGWGYEAEQKDFSRVVRHFGGTYEYFTVVTKAGEVRYYGRGAQSLVTLPSHNGLAPAVPAVWALDRVMDGWGNYYDLHYNNDSSDFAARGLIVTDMYYTGHVASTAGTSGTGAGGTVDTFNAIHFGYDPVTRPDVRQVRFRDSILSKKSRLTSIVTPQGTYALSYATPNPLLPSRLEGITFCGGGECAQSLNFGWDWGDYSWDSTSAAALAYQSPIAIDGSQAGVQFVDLDGDGRVEMVESRSNSTGNTSGVWRHDTTGWVEDPSWRLTQRLAAPDGKRHAFLADIDGDGLLDVISDEFVSPGETDPAATTVLVSFNHSRSANGGPIWSNSTDQSLPSTMQNPSFSGSRLPGYLDTITDMNGDGRADFVRLNYNDHKLHVALSTAAGGWSEDVGYQLTIDEVMVLRDINRDGLPDLVWPDKAYLNTRSARAGEGYFKFVSGGGFTSPVNLGTAGERLGDVDGDGMFDSVSYIQGAFQTAGDPGYRGGIGFSTGMGYVAGGMTGYDQAFIDSSPNSQRLLAANPQYMASSLDFRFSLLDVNADGLVDLIRHHADGGQVFINTGTSWQVIGGAVAWNYGMPAGPNAVPGLNPIEATLPVSGGTQNVPGQGPGTFVDLDGDGITDVIQASKFGSQVLSKVYLNKFRPPVINRFPNGLARQSEVSFAVITTESARAGATPTYLDTESKPASAAYLSVPVRVVESVSTDNGVGQMLPTTYRYSNLRADSYGRGPQGFQSMTVSEPADGANPGMTTVTSFAQVYPYTGLPTSVVRLKQGLVTTTRTTYCDAATITNGGAVACTDQNVGYGSTLTPKEVIFVYPRHVVDTSYLRTSSLPEASARETITTTTDFQYDDFGNPTHTTVTSTSLDSVTNAGQTYQNETENVYDTSIVGDLGVRLGKVTSTTVTAQLIAPADPTVPARVHHTSFKYGSAIGITEWATAFGGQPLAMVKKIEEADAGVGIELDTAYQYDRFGNVVTTTVCGSDFSQCAPGAVSSMEPQFRTTRVSYDPASFVGTSGGVAGPLSYKVGRFPVVTTNAAGHKQYTAYDPITGNIAQQTGPNLVTTMFVYDFLGRLSRQTERVGTDTAAITFITRYWAPSGSVANAVVITVKKTPTDGDTWTYSDTLGREVLTAKRGFGGQFVRVSTDYDSMGRVQRVSSPYPDGQLPAFWTTNTYNDPLGRPTTITQDLAHIDDSGNNASVLVRTTYVGSQVFTDRILPCSNCVSPEGEVHRRVETKNALGKVVAAEVDGASTNPVHHQVHLQIRR